MNFNKEISTIERLAWDAGEMACCFQSPSIEVSYKPHDNSPVTKADKVVNDFLVRNIKNHFPNDRVIAEESEMLGIESSKGRVWYVDPIDGTKEFIRGGQDWSVMIGLAINGRSVFGIVIQPRKSDLFWAGLNRGGFYKHGQDGLEKSLLAKKVFRTEDIRLIQSRSHFDQKVQDLAQRLGITRSYRQGSIGLKMARIAQGEADLYMNFSGRCHLWDTCAGEIILREARGMVSDTEKNLLSYNPIKPLVETPFLAAAPGVYDLIADSLKEGSQIY